MILRLVFGVSCFAFGFGGVWGGGGADSVVAAPLFTERKLEVFCGSKSANSRLAAVPRAATTKLHIKICDITSPHLT